MIEQASVDGARASDNRRRTLGVFCSVCAIITLVLAGWQTSRALEKRSIEQTLALAARVTAPLPANLDRPDDDLWRRFEVTGWPDLERRWLLDNRTQDGRVGYEIYRLLWRTPNRALLVANGFVSAGQDRNALPAVTRVWGGTRAYQQPPAEGHAPWLPGRPSRVGLIGTLMPPEGNLVWSATTADPRSEVPAGTGEWPRRVQSIDAVGIAAAISREVGREVEIAPVVFVNEFAPRQTSRRSVRMSSATHAGYAAQWLGLTVVMGTGAVIAFRRQRATPGGIE